MVEIEADDGPPAFYFFSLISLKVRKFYNFPWKMDTLESFGPIPV